MADNSFSQIQQGAFSLLDAIKLKVKEVDDQLVKLDATVQKIFSNSASTPNALILKVKELEDTVKKLNEAFTQQKQNTNELTQARISLAKRTAEEVVNQRALAKAADTEAKANSQLVGAYQNLIAKRDQAKKALQDLIVNEKASIDEIKKAQREYDKFQNKINQANKATSNFSKTSLGGLVRGFRNLAGAFGLVGGAYLFANLAKDVFNTAKQMQGLDYALKTVTKSQKDYAQVNSFLSEITQKYGADLLTTTERYTKFLTAAQQSNVSMQDTERIFESVTKASGVLGLKTHELEGVYLALEQMLSKGKVTTEELRRQLGERLPGAFGIMAQALGVSVSKLDEMLKKGEVLSAEALPKFAVELEKAYGIESVEKIDTLQAAQTRLTNTWLEFINSISRDGSIVSNFFIGVMNFANQALTVVLTFFKSIIDTAQEVSDEIKEAFKSDATKQQEAAQKSLQKTLEETKATFDSFTDVMQKQASAMEHLSALENNLALKRKQQEAALGNIYKLEKQRNELIVANGVTKETEALLEKINAYKSLLPGYEQEINAYEQRIKLVESILNSIGAETGAIIGNTEARRELKDVLSDLEEENKKLQTSTAEEAPAILDRIDKLNKEKEAWERLNEAKKKVKDEPFQDPSSLKSMQEMISKLKDMQGRVEYGSIAFGILGDQIKVLETIYNGLSNEIENSNDKIKKQNDLLLENILKWSDAQNEINKAIFDFQSQFREGFITEFMGDIGFDFLSEIVSQFDEIKSLIDSGLVTWEDYFLGISEIAQETFNFLNKNQEAYFDNQLDRLAEEKEESIRFAGDSTAAKEEIERQYEEKRKQILRKKAESEKKLAIFNTIIDTAQAVVGALAEMPWPANLAFAALAGAMGAAQIAMISSQPIPEYFRGTENAPEGWAWTQEYGAEIITDRQGKVKSLGNNDGATLTYLEQGDRVFSHDKSKKLFNDGLKNLLLTNDIEYSAMNNMTPKVVVENKTDNRDLVRHINSLENTIKNKQEFDLKIDKNGFYVGQRKNGARIERLNNIIRLKGKGV